MNVSQNNIDALNAKLQVKITPADYSEKVDKAIKKYSKQANIPGFRPGCAPVGMIKKRFGKDFLAEEINRLISEALYNHIKDNKVEILGEPLPSEGFTAPEIVDGAEMEFSFDIAIAPKLDAKIDGAKLNYYTIDIDDKMVDQQIAAYRGRFGSYVKADKSEAKDVLKGTIVELDEKGKEKADGVKTENALLSPNYMKDNDEQGKCLGKAVGESFVFNPAKAFASSEAEIASLLTIDREAAKNFASDCKFTISEITRYAEAEMNQEFFNKCFGDDVVKSEDELKAKIKEELAAGFVGDSDFKLLLDTRDYILNKCKDAQFPEAFLKRWLLEANKEMTAEKIDEEYPKMIEDLKWQIVRDAICVEAGVKIEKADIEAAAKKSAKERFAQYGMIGVPDEILASYVKEMLENKDGAKDAAERAGQEKLIEVIKGKAAIKNSTISRDEFQKFFEQK